MRQLLTALVVTVACLANPAGAVAQQLYVAELRAPDSARPGASNPYGFAAVAFDDQSFTFVYAVGYTDLSAPATFASIRFGLPDQDGPMIFNLGPVPASGGGYFEGMLAREDFTPSPEVPTFEDAIRAFLGGDTTLYLDSEERPNALRGQLVPFMPGAYENRGP